MGKGDDVLVAITGESELVVVIVMALLSVVAPDSCAGL